MLVSTKSLEQIFHGCKLTSTAETDRVVKTIAENRARYDGFAPFPWWVVACVHYCEASLSFSRHLHNGDPLTARTVRVPVNRPPLGEPPFTWEQSARDALSDRKPPEAPGLGAWLDWLERYNGLGYRRRGIPSPYVWACTDAYRSGLYVADGRFDANAVDTSPGCAAVLKALEAAGLLCFN